MTSPRYLKSTGLAWFCLSRLSVSTPGGATRPCKYLVGVRLSAAPEDVNVSDNVTIRKE